MGSQSKDPELEYVSSYGAFDVLIIPISWKTRVGSITLNQGLPSQNDFSAPVPKLAPPAIGLVVPCLSLLHR